MRAAVANNRAAHTIRPDVIRGVETFAVGIYPGDEDGETWEYTPEDLEAIVRNFAELSAGENPLHTVNVVQTHDGVDAHGKVATLSKDGELLLTAWQDVSSELRQKIIDKKIRKTSPEIKRDFTDRQGKVYPGPYLYRVAALGADVPRVKGMADIEVYADRVFKFSDDSQRNSTMDRTAAAKFLTEMGVDKAIVDGLSDQAILAVAGKWQADDVKPIPPTVIATPVPAPAPVPIAQPVQTFADPAAIRKLVTDTVAEVVGSATKSLRDAADAERQAREARAAEDRQAGVRQFCDRMATAAKLSPADNDEGSPLSVRSRMLRTAATPQQATHKFTDPATKKEATRTELELQQAEIEARQPQRFSERVKVAATAANGAAATPADPFAAKVAEHYRVRAEKRAAAAAAAVAASHRR